MTQPLADTYLPTLNHLASQALTNHSPDKAIPLLQFILKNDDHNYPALCNLGTAYKLKGNYAKALSFYRQAAKIEPNNPEIQFNLGQLYLKTRQYKLALVHLIRSHQLGGNYRGLEFNRAVCYEETGNITKAQSLYEAIIAKKDVTYLPALSNLAKLYQNTWQWGKLCQITPNLDNQITQAAKAHQPIFEKPYTNLLRSDNKSLNLTVAKNQSNFLKSTIKKTYFPVKTELRLVTRPLNIGYLSCDIGDHVMAYHIYPLFRLHNRHHFKIHTYSYGSPNQSLFRKRIQTHSDVWRDLSSQSAAAIAKQIHDDHIDILIDLAGHTGNSRFEVMARRPAPIQAHYLGFPGSTGADYIDYLFTDKVLTPPSYQKYFSEKLIYLPDCYQLNPPEKSNPHRFTRTQMGLPESGVVFCCFNQSRKITPEIMTIWFKLLKNVPNSVLWLVKSNDIATQNIYDFAAAHHIDPNRLIFAPFIEFDQQLDRLSLADIALDPILYNGGATTSDALLAGIPVITKTGTRYVSRMSTSMLTCLDLSESITTSLNDYYNVALDLATHPDKLKNLKSKIIIHKSKYPLFNPEIFVRNLESVYLTIWQHYMQGKPSQSFSVKSAS